MFSAWRNIGQQKEQDAKRWLKQQQIKVINENFRCKGGEIDLISLSNSDTLLFIEVKYRKSAQHGYAAELVDHGKQQRIIHCAQHFLLKYPQYQHHAMRFDIITLEGKQQTPTWLQDAFQAF